MPSVGVSLSQWDHTEINMFWQVFVSALKPPEK